MNAITKADCCMRSMLFITIVVIFGSCGDRDKSGKPLDTPTSGSVKIAVDASLQPLIDAEVDAFESIYTYADLNVSYGSEANAVDALLKDSVKMIIVTRELTGEELKSLENQKIFARQVAVAKEGISLIVHPDNPDSIFKISELREILQGKVSTWKQLKSSSSLGDMQVVFDQPDAGIVRFLHDSVYAFEQLPSNCFALKSDSAVIDYVSQNPNAIGLIGASWISDKDDSTTNKFLQSVRVVALAGDQDYYQPYQAHIALGNYPLSRDVVLISREARVGLASGFLAFVAGDKGQRIVLKAGLVPSSMPVRVVEINRDPLSQ